MDREGRVARFEKSLAEYLEPGEHVVAGTLGRAGSSPSLTPAGMALDQVKAGEAGGRMVALTDRRVIVARTSVWWGWRVKRIIATHPIGTPVRVTPEGIGALIEVEGVRLHTNRPGKRWADDLAAASARPARGTP